MGTLFLIPSLLVLLTCFDDISTKEIRDEFGFTILKRISAGHDFDLLVFTQEWPATACLEWKKRDESHTCMMPPNADTWTIHGIWPTKLGEMGPEFCNRTWLFDPEQVRPIEDQLEKVWVNIYADTKLYSLWAHEWSKHGTCAAQLEKFNSELKYFSMGLELSKQYSLNEILQTNNIVPSNTKQYTIVDINNAIKGKLRADPVISCKKEDGGVSYISDVRICLTKDLKPTNCDGIVARTDFDGQSILTTCNRSKDITYPHYVSNNNYLTIQLYRLISWLQWFTL